MEEDLLVHLFLLFCVEESGKKAMKMIWCPGATAPAKKVHFNLNGSELRGFPIKARSGQSAILYANPLAPDAEWLSGLWRCHYREEGGGLCVCLHCVCPDRKYCQSSNVPAKGINGWGFTNLLYTVK